MLRVIAFPAAEGDCFVVEWGDAAAPHRMLIDGGRSSTWRNALKGWLGSLPEGQRRLDLFVITHIDRDHIEGAIDFAQSEDIACSVDDVWYNAWRHITSLPAPRRDRGIDVPVLGVADGEALGRAIAKRGWRWNGAFGGATASVGGGPPPVLPLPGNAAVRLLSPDGSKLKALAKVWKRECRRLGLAAGGAGPAVLGREVAPPRTRIGTDLVGLAGRLTAEDDAIPNGSSIAFVFEFEDRRILFAADAHPQLLVASLKAHYGEAPARIDLLKVSHHGSRANVTTGLCRAIDCAEALVSTSGVMFSHPDEEAIARLILSMKAPRRLHFNYRSPMALSWGEAAFAAEAGFAPSYPGGKDGWCILNLERDGVRRMA